MKTQNQTAPVSAVMPAYNAAPFIREAIESVFAQTVAPAEFFVVDDGSTDDSARIAESMGVRVISQANAGLPGARNRCVREALQPWVAFIDDDDAWMPEKIERQMEIVSQNPEVGLVSCDFTIFDEQGTIVRSGLEKYRRDYDLQPKRRCRGGVIIDQLDERFASAHYFLLPTYVMIRRDLLRAVGMFDETIESAEDFDCFMRVIAGTPFAIAEKNLVRRREHANNASSRLVNNSLQCLAVTYKVIEHPELYPPATVALCKRWLPSNLRHAAARQLSIGNRGEARKLLRESVKLELSTRTLLALSASITPAVIGKNLMSARYFVSKRFGI